MFSTNFAHVFFQFRTSYKFRTYLPQIWRILSKVRTCLPQNSHLPSTDFTNALHNFAQPSTLQKSFLMQIPCPRPISIYPFSSFSYSFPHYLYSSCNKCSFSLSPFFGICLLHEFCFIISEVLSIRLDTFLINAVIMTTIILN